MNVIENESSYVATNDAIVDSIRAKNDSRVALNAIRTNARAIARRNDRETFDAIDASSSFANYVERRNAITREIDRARFA